MAAAQVVVVHEGDVARDDWDDPVRGALGFFTVFSADRTPTAGLTAGVALLPPGGWLGAHRHVPAEIYHVVEGGGLVRVDDREYEVRAGSSVYVPTDAEHEVRNVGPGPLRFFYAFAVDSFADVEYRFEQERVQDR